MSALRSSEHGSPLTPSWVLALLVAAGAGILLAATADSSDPRSVEQVLNLRGPSAPDAKHP